MHRHQNPEIQRLAESPNATAPRISENKKQNRYRRAQSKSQRWFVKSRCISALPSHRQREQKPKDNQAVYNQGGELGIRRTFRIIFHANIFRFWSVCLKVKAPPTTGRNFLSPGRLRRLVAPASRAADWFGDCAGRRA